MPMVAPLVAPIFLALHLAQRALSADVNVELTIQNVEIAPNGVQRS